MLGTTKRLDIDDILSCSHCLRSYIVVTYIYIITFKGDNNDVNNGGYFSYANYVYTYYENHDNKNIDGS